MNVDPISQIPLQETVKLNTDQAMELEARHLCVDIGRMAADGRIHVSAPMWLGKQLTQALTAHDAYKANYDRELAEWERWGKERKERKPIYSRKHERSVQVIARALDLARSGYPDAYDPGSILAI